MSTPVTRGKNSGTYSTRGNANRKFGNGQDRRASNSGNNGNSNSSGTGQTRGWGNHNTSAGGATLSTRGGYQQRSGSYSAAASSSPADLDAQKHMHDRLVYLLAKSIGSSTIVTVATGARFRGTLVAASTTGDVGVVLELAEKYANPPGEEDDSNGPEKFDKIVFQGKVIVDIEIESPDLTVDKPAAANAASSDFKTDTDISGQKGAIRERELQRWTADDDLAGLSLEDSVTSSSQPWDQFAVNQSKFGVKSTYDEHLYTTVIDKNHPEYQRRERAAEKIADEILKSSHNGNVHMAEERGIAVDDSGLDEEDKYSGVDRRASAAPAARQPSIPRDPTKYTPPALRQNNAAAKPTSKPTPYDPAIISSSMSSGAPIKTQGGPPVEPSTGGTSTPIADLFKASQGVTTAEQSKPTTTTSSEKPLPPSVALPASSRAKGDKDSKPKSGKPPATPEAVQKGLAGDFKEFVSTEMEKVQLKKQALHSREKIDRIHDFKKFSQEFKIKAPVPIDLVPILGKPKDPLAPRATTSPTKNTIAPAVPAAASAPLPHASDLSAKITAAHKSDSPPKVPSPLPKKNVKPVAAAATPSPAPKSAQPSPAPTEKKLNLNFKAPEFRPNPAAHSFTPSFAPPSSAGSSNVSSPAITHPQTAHTPRQNRPGNFYFGNKSLCSKSMRGKFNLFLKRKEEGDAPIERAYMTPPTWPTPTEKSYTEFLSNETAQRSYYAGRPAMPMQGPAPGMAGGANMVPVMQPGFEDPNFRGMMGSGPMPGQVAFIPNGMGYGQFAGAPQFYGRAPQPYPMPNMMGQGYMGFNPQQGGYQSPRGPHAMMVPAMGQQGFQMGGPGYYSPQQQHPQPYIRNNSHGHNRFNNHAGNGHNNAPPSGGPSVEASGDEGKA